MPLEPFHPSPEGVGPATATISQVFPIQPAPKTEDAGGEVRAGRLLFMQFLKPIDVF